jgi:hypothetical protein
MATEAPKATETVVSTGVTPAVEKVEEKKEEWKPRISVFNLPAGVTSQDELRELCKPFGTITNVEFVPAKGNRNAFGFVTFKTKGDAEYAIYRLNEENYGGKVPVKAKWPPEKDASKQKDESADGKPKKKKPMTSLSLLTPKNVASNAQHQNAAPLNKKGWDIPAQGQNNQQGGQKKQYQQVQQGGDNSQNQNQYPKGPRGKKQGGPNQGRPNQGQAGGQQGGNQKPVHQPRPNQGGQQAGGQHPNQPYPNQGGPKGKKNQQQQHQGQQNDASVPQQNQQQNSQPAQQNQQPRGKAAQQQNQQHDAAPQQQNPPQQNNAQQQNPQQPRNPRKKQPKKAYVVTVADGKTGLPLHVINLSKPQFDQYIGPLVVKPAPQ